MDRKEIRDLWNKNNLSCRYSYKVDYIKSICAEFGISEKEIPTYRGLRYRELGNDKHEKVDGEDFLILICEKHKIVPDPKMIECADKMFGEGSRRSCVEEAYLEEEKPEKDEEILDGD